MGLSVLLQYVNVYTGFSEKSSDKSEDNLVRVNLGYFVVSCYYYSFIREDY